AILLFSPFFVPSLAPTSIHHLSLHDALPILFFRYHSPQNTHKRFLYDNARKPPTSPFRIYFPPFPFSVPEWNPIHHRHRIHAPRSEEHTSELQSRFDLVCRLLLEKKQNNRHT